MDYESLKNTVASQKEAIRLLRFSIDQRDDEILRLKREIHETNERFDRQQQLIGIITSNKLLIQFHE